jgi:hypothetical protein
MAHNSCGLELRMKDVAEELMHVDGLLKSE